VVSFPDKTTEKKEPINLTPRGPDKERIELHDSFHTIIYKMSGGNPGAISVLMGLLKFNEKIDPDSVMGPIGAILSLDTHKVWEEKIWILFKDVCQGNIVHMVALLRSVGMGIIYEEELHGFIRAMKIEKERLEEITGKLKESLPNFAMDFDPDKPDEEADGGSPDETMEGGKPETDAPDEKETDKKDESKD